MVGPRARLTGDDLRAWVMSNLAYRDANTRSYRLGIVLVLPAMPSYQIAIAMALAEVQGVPSEMDLNGPS